MYDFDFTVVRTVQILTNIYWDGAMPSFSHISLSIAHAKQLQALD